MKTLKLAMAVMFLAFAMISYAGEETPSNEPPNKVIKIRLTQAITNPGLLEAMVEQLDLTLIHEDISGYYVGVVTYNEVTYWVFGPLNAWKRFFDRYGADKIEPVPAMKNRLE